MTTPTRIATARIVVTEGMSQVDRDDARLVIDHYMPYQRGEIGYNKPFPIYDLPKPEPWYPSCPWPRPPLWERATREFNDGMSAMGSSPEGLVIMYFGCLFFVPMGIAIVVAVIGMLIELITGYSLVV